MRPLPCPGEGTTKMPQKSRGIPPIPCMARPSDRGACSSRSGAVTGCPSAGSALPEERPCSARGGLRCAEDARGSLLLFGLVALVAPARDHDAVASWQGPSLYCRRDLLRVERLPLEQHLGDAIELVAIFRDELARQLVLAIHDCADLLVD